MLDLDSLKAGFKGEIVTDENTLAKFSQDTSVFSVRPDMVLAPTTSLDLQFLTSWVNANKKNNPSLSLTSRAAGTDMTGGPLNDSIIINFLAHLNQVLEIGSDYCVVQPGVYFRDLEKQLSDKGVWFPPYPASKEICALGGMIANNAGGEKTLQYGKVNRYVQSLKVILSDGKEYVLGKLDKAQLETKMDQKNLEGDIYRKVQSLLTTNLDLITKAKINVSKNSSGYNIWDVLTPDGGMDLTQLFVGSQGTLGIWTEAKLKVLPRIKFEKLYVVFINDLQILPQFTQEVLALKPTSLEITDDHTFKIYLKYAREMAELLGAKDIFSMLKLFLPEAILVLTGGIPKLILLVEFEGNNEEELSRNVLELEKIVQKFKLRGRYCATEQEKAKYWRLRRDTFKLLREKIKGAYPTPFVDDLEVRPEILPEFWPKLTKILDDNKIIYNISGHLGDGNLHIIPLMNLKSEADRQKIMTVRDQVYNLVLEYHGSLSAEHNDGLIRGDYLEKEYGPEIFAIFKQIKQIFDPQNIFNPHKKTDSNRDYMKSHIRSS